MSRSERKKKKEQTWPDHEGIEAPINLTPAIFEAGSVNVPSEEYISFRITASSDQ